MRVVTQEQRAVEGEWLYAVFSRAGRSTHSPWGAWGATCDKCDAESHGRAPVVAIATLVAAVGLEAGQARGTASNEVVRLALGSLIAWLSDVVWREDAEGAEGAEGAEVAERGGGIVEAAMRDVADDARARGAAPPPVQILEHAMGRATPLASSAC